MPIKQITIFGSTGLIGNHTLEFLLNDNEFEKINLVSRRPTFIKNKKIKKYIIDFNNY